MGAIFECQVSASGPMFFESGKLIRLSALEIFQIAQRETFTGDRGVSAIPADIGLRLTSTPPTSQLSLLAKPRRGEWSHVDVKDAWLDDGSRLHFISADQRREIIEVIEGLGLNLGTILFRAAPSLASELADSFYLEIEEPVWEADNVQRPSSTDKHFLEARLHPYQSSAVERITNLCKMGIGSVLADEMGLGKTLQAIAVAVNIANKGGQVLVVVPPILLPNWRRELQKFAPSLAVATHHRTAGSTLSEEEMGAFDVVLAPFSSLTSTSGDFELLASKTWDLVILDEAQFIKNPDAKRSSAAKRLPREASLALSGTPVENSPLDVWSLSEFIFPSLLGGREDFDTDISLSATAFNRVQAFFKPIMIRRTLDEVSSDLRLPDRIEKYEYLEMGSQKMMLQEEVLNRETSNQSKFQELLMLAAESHKSDEFASFCSSNKWQRLQMLIENGIEESQKIIVFARYRAALDNLHLAIKEIFPTIFCATIRGDSGTPNERQAIVDRFSESKYGVLLLNPEAAGYGLNITAASRVVHLHPLWNPAKTDQATKRAHRPGQTRITTVHHLIYEGSVEEAIVDRSSAKRSLAEALLAGEQSTLDDVSIKDLLQSLKGVD